MTKIIRLLFCFESEFAGDSRYISGNALRHALSMQINTSNGSFTTISKLNVPTTHHEFFLPRMQKCFLYPHIEFFWDMRSRQRKYRCFFFPAYVTFDVIDPPDNLIEDIESRDLIQLGGQRNCGFGIISLKCHIEIDLDKLRLPRDGTHLVLLSPLVYFPRFVEKYNCRHEFIQLWNHNRLNNVRVISEGQFFRIKKGCNSETIARRGILRRSLFGKFGFGEFIVHNWKKN